MYSLKTLVTFGYIYPLDGYTHTIYPLSKKKYKSIVPYDAISDPHQLDTMEGTKAERH